MTNVGIKTDLEKKIFPGNRALTNVKEIKSHISKVLYNVDMYSALSTVLLWKCE